MIYDWQKGFKKICMISFSKLTGNNIEGEEIAMVRELFKSNTVLTSLNLDGNYVIFVDFK